MLESVTYSIRIPDTRVLYAVIEATALDPTASAGVKKEAEANLAWNSTSNQLTGDQQERDACGFVNDDILRRPNVTHQIAGQINGSWLVEFKDLPHMGSGYAPVVEEGNILMILPKEVSLKPMIK